MFNGFDHNKYDADERFAANYNRASETGPQFVRDALHRYADTSM